MFYNENDTFVLSATKCPDMRVPTLTIRFVIWFKNKDSLKNSYWREKVLVTFWEKLVAWKVCACSIWNIKLGYVTMMKK
jgi:hypothetical protein